MIETELNEKQRLLLWRLATAGGSEWLGDIAVGLSTKPIREGLIRSRLISEGKQTRKVPDKRTTHALRLTLEDRGWAWLADHMDLPIWKSNAAAEVLAGLLGQLREYCRRNEVALGEVFSSPVESTPPSDSGAPVLETGATTDVSVGPARTSVRDQIVAAYAQLAGNRSNARVRLADLRRRLAGLTRAEVDASLRQLVSDGSVVLNRLDNPIEITTDDEAAMIRNSLGEPRHILHMELAVGSTV